jgi:pyrimidine deaminase RibD-like protein
MPTEDELQYMKLAIAEARLSRFEDGRIHPYVGAVVVRNGQKLGSAHRSDQSPGDHAEFTVLEKKLSDEVLAGCTVYTTLEPCTTRRHPKVPCAERLIQRRVGRVVIGMLDPDQRITGKGILHLRSAGIAVDLFPPDLMAELEELNRNFIADKASVAQELLPHSAINWASIIEDARTELRACGFALAKVADVEATRLVAKMRESDFRAVLILNNPLAATATMRVDDERKNLLALSDIAKITLRLLDHRNDLKRLGKEQLLVVKHVNPYPTIAVVVVDNDLYAYWYPYGQLGTDSPILVFRGYKQSTLAKFFLDHLEALECIAEEPDVEKLKTLIPKGI